MRVSHPLVEAFCEHPLGLCGRHDPALALTQVEPLERRLHILTLGVVADIFMPTEGWVSLAGLQNHWLSDSSQVAYKSSQLVREAMQAQGLLGPGHLPRVWWQICRGIQGRFKGSLRTLLQTNQDHAWTILDYLKNSKTTFPVLSGPILSVRWLDYVQRTGRVVIDGWDALKVPLSATQLKAAQEFGIEGEMVHPQVALALQSWVKSCRQLGSEACGLSACPRKSA